MRVAARPILLRPLLLAPPFTATYAGPIPSPSTSIVVEYAGTISAVSEPPPGSAYAVGDRISGRLVVDRTLAGGEIGLNEATYRASSPAFVSGFWPSSGDPFDRVSIGNEVIREGVSRPIDIFGVDDWLVGEGGSQDSGRQFSVSATLFGFLHNNKLLDQNFEVTSADVDEPGESLRGGINFRLDMPSFVHFAVDRLSVKPGRCFAP